MIALLAALAVKAAVSQVTIFSDRARVVRGGDVAVDGRTAVELPLLPDSVDATSIRVSFPVPAARSRTRASGPRPSSRTSHSTAPGG